jgi:putative endonuclease
MVYVYILQSRVGKGYYIGICNNLEKRLEKHNKGGVYSTKKHRPFRIIYSEKYESYSDARIREKEIKSYKGGNTFRSLISQQ